MKKTFITLFIILNSIIAYCQHPYIQDLRSLAQVTFPDTPEVKYSDGASYYIYRNKDNDLYFAQVTDLNKINPDSIDSRNPDNIYTQFINGILRPIKGEIFYTEKIKNGGFDGIEYDYKCELKSITYYGYQQVFRFNNSLISYSLLSPDSLIRSDKKINSFFSTFKFTPDKAADLDKKSSFLAGLLMISSVLFVGSLAIFVIGKSRKKKRYEWIDKNDQNKN
ncbi:hypothetical protein HDF18_25825 [Mucilaginibacter sp. X5P1]|uniref:hypothetical protein n=1 Tax=Mucilaginibacter sp. X5P1 TaxID=2723088 RepID=UPI00160FD368|nr:hypothetical protein [Mucilaginibacter sp. X5P1]MBB6141508.1 hypothetical protein [Mucilaginibacter sp. X5P1]